MVDYKKLEYWTPFLKRAENARNQYAESYEWRKLKRLWNTGGQTVEVIYDAPKQVPSGTAKAAFPNWIYAFGQIFIPAVYWRHPEILVFPRSEQYTLNAKIAKERINRAFRETHFRHQARKALLDCLIYGHGWVKLGWYTRFGQVPPGVIPEGQKIGKESKTDVQLYLQNDNPYAYRVSPELILVDPDASSYEEARWIAQVSYVPIDRLKEDPFLKFTDNLVAYGYPETENWITSPKEKSVKWAKRYEIWDRENDQVLIWCEGSPKINRRIFPWPYQGLHGFPFKLLTVTDAIDELFPPSPILPWLPLVDELALIRTLKMEHLRLMVTKLLVQEGTLDEDQIRNLADPTQKVVFTKDLNGIREIRGLQPDANLYASEDKTKEDLREISGFSELLSGSVPFSRIAATTSAIMAKNAALRFEFFSERVADWIIECAKDLFKIVVDFQSYPQVVRIGEEPELVDLQYDKKAIEGEFTFSVDIQEMSISSKEQRIKEAYDKLVALAPFPETKNYSLIKDFLNAYGSSDPDKFLNPPPGPPLDPIWENQQMARGYPIEPNPNEDTELHLRVHGDFVGSEFYRRLVAQNPQIGHIFSEHIQKTTVLSRLLQKEESTPRPGVSQNVQKGQRLVTSSPPVASQNQYGMVR